MTDRMQKYVDLDRRMPTKRAVAERLKDFGEISPELGDAEAADQASRCEQCATPYCHVFCPLHNNIPDWLQMTAEGRLEEAYALAQATNNFPEICGRICPQDRLCEAKWACTLEQAGHGAVTIGAVERHITENAWRQGWVQPRRPRSERAERVAIIGAGPAGMAAAEELRARGYRIDLYDRHDRMGGLMIYGIPEFKLEKNIVARRARLLLDAGIRFHPRVTLGRDVTLDELREDCDALLLAIGAQKPRPLDLPGVDLAQVVPALDYLVEACRRTLGEPGQTDLDAAGRRVVVIGGGDTAMDCVRTAVRQGARSVACLYRRDRENMPGSAREVAHAEEEGIAFLWQAQPEALLGVPVEIVEAEVNTIVPSPVAAVRAVRTHLSGPDVSGRREPQPIPGSAFEIAADLVVNALGFTVADLPALTGGRIGTSPRGAARIDRQTMMTEVSGVFAAGDLARGPSLAVWAIRDGREAATQIDRYLQEQATTARGPTLEATGNAR